MALSGELARQHERQRLIAGEGAAIIRRSPSVRPQRGTTGSGPFLRRAPALDLASVSKVSLLQTFLLRVRSPGDEARDQARSLGHISRRRRLSHCDSEVAGE